MRIRNDGQPWGTRYAPAAERFRALVAEDGPLPEKRPDLGPCHLWLGCKTGRGYGTFGADSRHYPAHRYAYEHQVGPVPEGKEPDHLCERLDCVNVHHLELVTHAENIQRYFRGQLACRRGHPRTAGGLRRNRNGRYVYSRCLACERESLDRKKARRAAGLIAKENRSTPGYLAWARTRYRVLPILKARTGSICEGCGWERARLDVQHVFGRPGSGACLGAAANRPELLQLLCRPCHNACDRATDLPLRDRLRWVAVDRLCASLGVSRPADSVTPVEAVRTLVRELDALGITPDPSRELEERG